MKKHHAHLILLLFDFFACVAVYWCIAHFLMVKSLIDGGADKIEFESSIFYMAFTIVVPVLHSFTWLNKKDWAKPINNRQGAILAFIIIFLGITKYYLVSKVEEQLKIEGYVFCSELIKGRYHHEVYQKTICRS